MKSLCEQRKTLGFGQGGYGILPYGGGTIAAPPPPIIDGPGFVSPSYVNNELNDQQIRRFLNVLVSGITLIPGDLVRPRWQPEPPNQPDFDKDWAAIGIVKRTRDVFSAVVHCTDPENFEQATDTESRNQILEILCSFYGPNSDQLSEVLAMGLGLEQNRYALQLNGFGLVEVEESLAVPAIVKDRWLMGMDIHFRLRRLQIYTYDSPNLKGAIAELDVDGDPKEIKTPITVDPGYGSGNFGDLPFNL